MVRSVRAPLAAACGCAAGVGLLAACVFGIDAVQRVDSDLLNAAMAPSGDDAGSGVYAVGHLANPLAVALLLAFACGIALLRRRPLAAAAAVTVVAGANLTTTLLKHLFETPRIQPVFINHELLPTGIFPSGHATAAASVAIAFAFVVPRAALPLAAGLGALYVAAVDTAVLILAWHYPSDVLAGTLVAAAWGFATLAAVRVLSSPDPESGPAPGQPPETLSPEAALPSR
jgi:membrane-associated phospholipid phosphatase